jgi:hypothetical protein
VSIDFDPTSSCEPEVQAVAAEGVLAKLKRFAELTTKKRELEAQLRPIEAELSAMEESTVEDMALEGMQSMNVDGQCLYRQREFFARLKSDIDKEIALARLMEAGYGHVLGLSWQTLKGLAREWSEEGQEPPAIIKELCEVGETYRLRCRKAS